MNSEKKCIGIIFGGNSNEHEISRFSAQAVFKAFESKTNKKRFEVKVFYISKEGNWFDSYQSIKILFDENLKNTISTSEILNQDKINFLDKIDFQSVDIWFPF